MPGRRFSLQLDVLRRCPASGDDVRQQQILDLEDLILQRQLPLFHALNLNLIRMRLLGQRIDRVIEVAMLGAQIGQLLLQRLGIDGTRKVHFCRFRILHRECVF